MGKEHPPKDPGCAIEWKSLTADEVQADYEILGSVTTGTGGSRTSELSTKVKQNMEQEACKLGGESLSLATGTTGGLGKGAAAYWVLLPKNPAASEPEASDGDDTPPAEEPI